MSGKVPVIVWHSRKPEDGTSSDQHEVAVAEEIRAEEISNDAFFHMDAKKVPGKRSKLQVLLVTTVSAIVLGVLIGTVMLKLLTVFETDEAAVTVSGHANAAMNKKSELLSAYVLQGGVFTKKKNADEWLAKYEKAGVPAVLWQRDGSYYLFAGAAPAEKQAAEQAKLIEKAKLDIYIKEWTAPIAKGELKDNEKKWLSEFSTVWNRTLQKTGETHSASEWNSLIKSAPAKSTACQNLAKGIEANLDKLKAGDSNTVRQALLNIWKSAEKIS
ncbi:hypothetical protein QR721_08520 [Aciduricibacillus chroicocephali]|uniref:SPOR domain-containing protein n=1 Tax=Aciduricibacillus chroicocephali TaxID=3054939 RepID=A0ABY9KVM6_9BACI|nr:hypothetical protein QR721_08520 [Bacillaceae bacterium 44XB]